jgi:RHS repeat-associated protein
MPCEFNYIAPCMNIPTKIVYKKKYVSPYDPGGDGDVHSSNNATVARDAYGFTLSYFNGDYRSIGHTNFQTTGLPITSQYNGNIAGATYSIKNLSPSTLGYTYSFDQLNRYRGDSVFKTPDSVNNNWNTRTGINDLKERVSYDENGNILVYLRHGNTAVGSLAMDSLTYHYTKGRNQLTQVNDAVNASNYSVDIDNETSNRNYQYNGIGELAKDSAGGLDTIIWNVYGKVKAIRKHNGDSIVIFYDPVGNRLEKRLYPHSGTADTTKYTRDASGNIMAIYDRHKDTVRLTEWDMYGAGRIGSVDTILRMQKLRIGVGTLDSLTIMYLEGQKQYELTNHLGNVLVTVSDKKIPVDTVSTDTLAKYYLPLVITATSYAPYGMVEPGRSYNLPTDSSFNFGFNSMMEDNSIYGTGDYYSTFYRGYDPRLGRWLSNDPKMDLYPNWSPYSFSLDNPLTFIDPHGDGPGFWTINEIVSIGKKSSMFSKLLKEAEVPLDNPNQVIEFANGPGKYRQKGYRGVTICGVNSPENGCILIEDNASINELIIVITHELTNRINIKKTNEIMTAYLNGEIDADEYAYEICLSELEGIVNQYFVEAEIGYISNNAWENDLLSKINNHEISRDQLKQELYGNSKEDFIKSSSNYEFYKNNTPQCLNYTKINVRGNHGKSKSKKNKVEKADKKSYHQNPRYL